MQFLGSVSLLLSWCLHWLGTDMESPEKNLVCTGHLVKSYFISFLVSPHQAYRWFQLFRSLSEEGCNINQYQKTRESSLLFPLWHSFAWTEKLMINMEKECKGTGNFFNEGGGKMFWRCAPPPHNLDIGAVWRDVVEAVWLIFSLDLNGCNLIYLP